ncbi:MAG: glycosyltransferase [Cyanobacteria bacterium P01_G01_bin.19]
MTNIPPHQSVIVLTGMHRSGTSLTASILQSAGVDLGDRLMGVDRGNPKGHFEDLDFVEFHQNVLQSQGVSVAGWTELNSIEVQQQYLLPAKKLISARQDKPVWGWKDPRTTLFLDFWSQLIPQAKYIFVYRSPWEVVDSLFRRGDVIFQTNPNFAVKQWCNYNRAILNFYQDHSDNCLLWEISDVIQHQSEVLNSIAQKWQIELQYPESTYEPSLFHGDDDRHYRQAIISQFFPEAINLYQQLREQGDFSKSSVGDALDSDTTCQSWILQDWLDLKRISQTQDRAEQSSTEAKTELEAANQELAQTKTELEAANQELVDINQKLQYSEHKLNEALQQAQIAQMQADQFRLLIVAMETSKFWKLRTWWLNFKQKNNLGSGTDDILYQNYLLSNYSQPVDGKATAENVALGVPTANTPLYSKWLQKKYPNNRRIRKLTTKCQSFPYKPLISVIMPVYNPEAEFLRQAIASVCNQAYVNWELCIADDCSSKPHVKEILDEFAQQDSRIKVVYREENGHICHSSNSAIELATGEYIALLDHDDLLAPHALASVAELLNQHPEADFIYSDEDKVDDNGVHQDHFFKPDWCPDSFLSRMYTCHLGVYRRSLVNQIGNFRPGFEGSQDYDLVLRITEQTDKIFHIPDILYHWRIHLESTAGGSDAKPYAAEAAEKAINEAIARRGEPGKITTKDRIPGVYIVRYEISDSKLVSIIIPTKDLADVLDVCLESIFTLTTYPNYEVVVIDNGSVEEKTQRCFDKWREKEPNRFKCYRYDVPFNYSKINNYGATKAEGDYLLLLNNDTKVVTPDWLEAMVEQAQRPSIGAVGSMLLYPDDTIQHAGVVLGIGGVAGHSHKYFPITHPGYISQLASINNYSAVTGACLMCRREVFEAVGGLEENLAIAFNDVDFCLKIISRGYRNIHLPHVILYHYESKSRGYEDTPKKQARFAQEVNYMQQKWHQLCDNDPCYNPNLTRCREDYSLNI